MPGSDRAPPTPVLDWAKARERLDEIGRHLTGALSPEGVQARMARRATALAAPEPATETSAPVELVAFSLGAERYAIALAATSAVMPVTSLVRLPDTDPVHLGIVAHRGELFALVDPNRLLERPGTGVSPAPALAVLLNHPDCAIALAADDLIGVMTPESHLPTPALPRSGPVIALLPDGTHVLSADALARNARLIVDHRPRLSPAS